MNYRMTHIAGCAALLAAAVFTGAACATPYLPTSGSQVIEVLPKRSDPVQRELLAMRTRLSASPTDLPLATALAQRYIAVSRSQTDPRYLGYAQAALAPWWQQPAPPPQVRLLRATLLQSTHHFDQAMLDLDAVVVAEPANAQAWLTRATVLTVQGKYPAATAACARVSNLANELVTITCIANVASITGRALKSEQLLDLTLQRGAGADPQLQLWVMTLLAEMATRRGDAAAAEARYLRALALAPRDSYLLGAYADFLLDQQRNADVAVLLKDTDRIDALLLRRALALKQAANKALKQPTARELAQLKAAVAELGERFHAAMQRGDTVHQREQARFELYLRDDKTAALTLAQQNWAVQKEAADMRIYLEAASAAHQPAAARPVLDWVKTNKVEDVAIARLVTQLTTGT